MRHNTDKWMVLALVLVLPLLSMALMPFSDTTEPRYAEIARLMLQTGDWITPWFSPGVPFWGKPPLSFWAQAGSMMFFGVNEFAARLPSWLCGLSTTWLLFYGVRRLYGSSLALWTIIIYNSCALAYVISGAVLTDPFLALGTTLSMVSFALVRRDASASRVWGYGFFVGLSIGLLAKGPLAAVLIFVPVVLELFCHRRAQAPAGRLPWLGGSILTVVLSVPWYVIAEIKTPGFLDYFIVGEHFRRFLDAGWQGDLYGTAHQKAFGTIWVYWLQGTFPWGVLMLIALVCAVRSMYVRAAFKTMLADPLRNYWLAWALFTPVFFTLSANILWTYLLPALAAFSVLAARLLEGLRSLPFLSGRRSLLPAAVVPVVVLVLTVVMCINPDIRNSERTLVHYVAQRGGPDASLFYLSKQPFSAQFYSRGKAMQITLQELEKKQASCTPFYLAVPKDEQTQVAGLLGHPLAVAFQNRRYVLIKLPAAQRDTQCASSNTKQ